jgi:radical SAM protein with 4Fe4S-binding SPASM domain
MVQPNSVSTITENFVFLTEEYGQPLCTWWLVRDDIWSEDDIKKYDYELKRVADKNIEYFKNGVKAMCGLLMTPIIEMYNSQTVGKQAYSCISGCWGLSFSSERYAYPCTRFLTNNRYPIFDIKTNSFIEENFKHFSIENKRNCPSGTPECKGCSLYNFCNRGCKHEELVEEDGNVFFKPLESICKLYHIGYREANRMLDELKDNKLFRECIKETTNRRGM